MFLTDESLELEMEVSAFWASHPTEPHAYFDVSMSVSTLAKGDNLKIGLPFPWSLKHRKFKIFWVGINGTHWKPFSHVGKIYSSDRTLCCLLFKIPEFGSRWKHFLLFHFALVGKYGTFIWLLWVPCEKNHTISELNQKQLRTWSDV